MKIINEIDIKNLNCDEQAPIMIGGAKRSGTTLLRKILGAHSLATCTPPDFLFNFVYNHLYSYGDLNQKDNLAKLINDCLKSPIVKNYFEISLTPEEIIPFLPEKSFRGVYMTLNYLYMKNSPTPYLVCKTPCNVFWFKEIHRMFPKARFIFLYRDGRDASIDQVELDWGANNIYTASLEWQSYIGAMLESKRYLPKDSCYEIYYENMVRQPEQEISKICKFLGLEYEPDMLQWYEKKGDSFSSAKAYHQITNSPITEAFVGMYKNLPEEDRKLFATVIGDTLRQVGYTVKDEPREIDFWEREWYLEEERYAALIPEGALEYKCRTRNEREERRKRNVWTYADRNKQFGIF